VYTTGFIKENEQTLCNTKDLPPGVSEKEFVKLFALLAEGEREAVIPANASSWWKVTHVR
jgi:hypothetical protein